MANVSNPYTFKITGDVDVNAVIKLDASPSGWELTTDDEISDIFIVPETVTKLSLRLQRRTGNNSTTVNVKAGSRITFRVVHGSNNSEAYMDGKEILSIDSASSSDNDTTLRVTY